MYLRQSVICISRMSDQGFKLYLVYSAELIHCQTHKMDKPASTLHLLREKTIFSV